MPATGKATKPTLWEAVFYHVLRGIGARRCRATRPKLTAGKAYPFAVNVTGTVNGRQVRERFAGDLQVEHDTTEQRGPSARELLGALLATYPTPAAKSRLLRRLADAPFGRVPESKLKEADRFLARVRHKATRSGWAKVELKGDA